MDVSQIALREDSYISKEFRSPVIKLCEIPRVKSENVIHRSEFLKDSPPQFKHLSTVIESPSRGRRKWTLLKNAITAITRFQYPNTHIILNPVLSN